MDLFVFFYEEGDRYNENLILIGTFTTIELGKQATMNYVSSTSEKFYQMNMTYEKVEINKPKNVGIAYLGL